jgi:hypothetical protein
MISLTSRTPLAATHSQFGHARHKPPGQSDGFERRCALLAAVMMTVTAAAAAAQPAPASTTTSQLVCASRPGERQTCAADTSAGVTLVTVLGAAVCERGKTWDYDAAGIWVSEGCSAVFAAAPPKASRGSFGPAGFKLADTDAGDANLKLMAYVRYLNQQGIDESYTDSFGHVKTVDPRHDVQFQKVNLQFLGWIGKPRLRYLAYVWTANTSQGLGAQVVVGGNLSYEFNRHLRVGGGIYALPGSRTLEGNFPFWLPLDNRLIAEEFFRPSYTMGILAQGTIADGLDYSAMIGNNLSQLGVDAGQLDSGLDALAMQLAWMPTTGEFGRGFGDYAQHERLATRFGAHLTRSDENRQSQPDTEGIENTQIRTSDGNVIFSLGLFGDGINITDAKYQMFAADAGAKYRGLSVESEFYWRTVSNLRGTGTEALPFREMHDSGFKVETSVMALPKLLQAYVSGSRISGEYGDPWDFKAGVNYYPFKNELVRWNAEYLYISRSPVGALSLPMPVGANGGIFFSSFLVNF